MPMCQTRSANHKLHQELMSNVAALSPNPDGLFFDSIYAHKSGPDTGRGSEVDRLLYLKDPISFVLCLNISPPELSYSSASSQTRKFATLLNPFSKVAVLQTTIGLTG